MWKVNYRTLPRVPQNTRLVYQTSHQHGTGNGAQESCHDALKSNCVGPLGYRNTPAEGAVVLVTGCLTEWSLQGL